MMMMIEEEGNSTLWKERNGQLLKHTWNNKNPGKQKGRLYRDPNYVVGWRHMIPSETGVAIFAIRTYI